MKDVKFSRHIPIEQMRFYAILQKAGIASSHQLLEGQLSSQDVNEAIRYANHMEKIDVLNDPKRRGYQGAYAQNSKPQESYAKRAVNHELCTCFTTLDRSNERIYSIFNFGPSMSQTMTGTDKKLLFTRSA